MQVTMNSNRVATLFNKWMAWQWNHRPMMRLPTPLDLARVELAGLRVTLQKKNSLKWQKSKRPKKN